jgi:uncharacterized protein (DUF488 family)
MALTKTYSIGFAGKSAGQFFGLLKKHGIQQLLDVRLNNISQLAGFTKKIDLEFFLQEIAGIRYIHEPLLAPSPELLKNYRDKKIDWLGYEVWFQKILYERNIEKVISAELFCVPTVLLCSEATATHCHRRLVLEYLQQHWQNFEIVHL